MLLSQYAIWRGIHLVACRRCFTRARWGAHAHVEFKAPIYKILGKRVFVPKILDKANSLMDCFEIYDEADLASLPSGAWGIKEPTSESNGKPRATGKLSKASDDGMIFIPSL